MTKNEVNILIQKPGEVLAHNLSELKTLAEQFPYSQAMQLLYAKALHKNKSIDYLQQLKYTSAITANRKVLYEIIMRQDLLDKISNLIIENDNEEQIEHAITQKGEKIASEQPEKETGEEKKLLVKHVDYSDYTQLKNNKSSVTKTDDYIFTAIETEKISMPQKEDLIINENEAADATEKPTEEKLSLHFSELEKQILWEAVNATVQVDVIKDLEQKPLIVSEEKSESPVPNQDFLGWLSGKIKHETKTTNEQNPINRSEIENLVDRFIQNDPKITPQKTAFFTPGNVAKLSITDNEDFVSETLAKIYEKQGYYPKAIKVYQKLSLKFPEKSAFFAARIEELKNKKQ